MTMPSTSPTIDAVAVAVPAGLRPPGGVAAVAARLWARRSARAALAVVALLVLAALAAPLLAHLEGQSPNAFHDGLLDSDTGGSPIGRFGGISAHHWLGVEPATGRDLFARLVYGARISLGVAFGATLGQLVIGLAVGLAAGLGGTWADTVLGRLTDLALSFPSLIFSIALLAVVPASFPRPLLLCLILALFGWAATARIVRAETLVLRERDYVSAARLSGATTWRLARREILPGVAGQVVTYTALAVPANMVAEAGLSFLGLGVKPPTSSWGQMLSGATTWFQVDPVYVLVPALTLLVTVLAFTALGEALRVALDPKAVTPAGDDVGGALDADAGGGTDAADADARTDPKAGPVA